MRPAMTPPQATSLLLPERDATFRLDEPARARIPFTLDPDALEAVLAWLRPDYRAQILASLSALPTAGSAALRVIPLSEGDPTWVSLPRELRDAVARLKIRASSVVDEPG